MRAMVSGAGGAAGGLRGKGFGEESFFLLTAAEQAGEDLASGVIPEIELGRGCAEIAFVEKLEQGGAGECAAAEVEGEVYERVKLILQERHGYGLVDKGGGGGDVAGEQRLRLCEGDGEPGMDIRACMAVADGPDADRILISGKAQAFELLCERKAGSAVCEVIHGHVRFLEEKDLDGEAAASIARMASFTLRAWRD
jgi:hypothetical protein